MRQTDRTQWKKITGFGRYEISTAGEIRSSCKEGDAVTLKQVMHWKGYRTIYLFAGNGERTKFFIHRLVATAFLPNPNLLPIVNHRDLDKSNNDVGNLEWTSDSGNQLHWRGMVAQKSEYDHIKF